MVKINDMNIEVYGKSKYRTSILAIGTWSPLFPADVKNIERMIQDAKISKMSVCLVLFYPKPGEILFDRSEARYDCVQAIINKLLELGVDKIIRIRMTKRDLEGNAHDFLRVMKSKYGIKKLYLGSHQSLGFATQGNKYAIRDACKLLKISIVYFQKSIQRDKELRSFKESIQIGDVRKMRTLLKRDAIWVNLGKKQYNIGWKVGLYIVDIYTKKGYFDSSLLRINKSPKISYFKWPPISNSNMLVFKSKVQS